MTLDDVKTLLDFHYWALDRVLTAAEALPPEQLTRDMGSSFKSVRDTLAHLYSAEWAWHQRWLGSSPTAHLPAERFADVPALRRDWQALERQVREFVERLGADGLERVFDYKLISGQPG